MMMFKLNERKKNLERREIITEEMRFALCCFVVCNLVASIYHEHLLYRIIIFCYPLRISFIEMDTFE